MGSPSPRYLQGASVEQPGAWLRPADQDAAAEARP